MLAALLLPLLAGDVVIDGPPIVPAPDFEGRGLCLAHAISTNPSQDFPQQQATFVTGMNAFIDAHRSGSVMTTGPLDFSNHAGGDFTGGADFPVGDMTTSFGARLRGFILLDASHEGLPVHLGVRTDDAVAVSIIEGDGTRYDLAVQPPQLGSPSWRLTREFHFLNRGLYAIEILYAQVVETADLEIALFDSDFPDVTERSNQAGSTSLMTAGFTLLDVTQLAPTQEGGTTDCSECSRSDGSGCALETFCNAAGLCESCVSEAHCGADCTPCSTSEPHCRQIFGEYVCLECTRDADCAPGFICEDYGCLPGPVDAGIPDAPDAAVSVDAAMPDAALPLDAAVPDAAVPVDAAFPPDASMPPDAAMSLVDAGVPDASQSSDASTPEPGTKEPNCGCVTTEMDVPAGWLIIIAIARRRREHA